MYKSVLKPILFLFEPEAVHNVFVALGEFFGRVPLVRSLLRSIFVYKHPALRTTVAGIDFENPVGLAAGFDKDMRLTQIIPEIGFGFTEIGSVTHLASTGNSGRHLVRLPEDKSLIIYYGLKNIGAAAISDKLRGLRFRFPVGLNIAKTNHPDVRGDQSIEDYLETYRLLADKFSYVTINVSCPNAQDGCLFQDPALLDRLLSAFSRERKVAPIFLKISTHLTHAEVDAILEVVSRYTFVDGFVLGNLSKRRNNLDLKSPASLLGLLPEGGISGIPIQKYSDDLLRYVYARTNGKYRLIGLGGIFSAEDAYRKIRSGASLVQLITGMIYEGPMLIRQINEGLIQLLKRDGFASVSDAVGADLRITKL